MVQRDIPAPDAIQIVKDMERISKRPLSMPQNLFSNAQPRFDSSSYYFEQENSNFKHDYAQPLLPSIRLYRSLLVIIKLNIPWRVTAKFLFDICHVLEDALFLVCTERNTEESNHIMLIPVLRTLRRWRMDVREGRNLEELAVDLANLVEYEFHGKRCDTSALKNISLIPQHTTPKMTDKISFGKPLPPNRSSKTIPFPQMPAAALTPSHRLPTGLPCPSLASKRALKTRNLPSTSRTSAYSAPKGMIILAFQYSLPDVLLQEPSSALHALLLVPHLFKTQLFHLRT
ncbi:hypothetical protein M422DRAFT_42440 [Sphaerobolus stellatus SS14]|nr:hypothetical protein M422DRAFT_42440 [Sphaerobolus stellatus SS14]